MSDQELTASMRALLREAAEVDSIRPPWTKAADTSVLWEMGALDQDGKAWRITELGRKLLDQATN